jgi:hypothetical protein
MTDRKTRSGLDRVRRDRRLRRGRAAPLPAGTANRDAAGSAGTASGGDSAGRASSADRAGGGASAGRASSAGSAGRASSASGGR